MNRRLLLAAAALTSLAMPMSMWTPATQAAPPPPAALTLAAPSSTWDLTSLMMPRQAGTPEALENPNIDMDGYLRAGLAASRRRMERRLSEVDFMRMSREPGAVILDARSERKYDELHVKGAVNLSFPDMTFASLARMIPDKSTLILIYCNNNFHSAEGPFPSKVPSAALNLSTYQALYSYGYFNVYELGPRVDPKESRLPFESSKRKGLNAGGR